ncbi:MAG: CHAT domain-containing protein [Oscillatoria sp. SIO1A7]|nr:CHAT domain-containing protein [Oscillatoria sp. SIO1A7]
MLSSTRDLREKISPDNQNAVVVGNPTMPKAWVDPTKEPQQLAPLPGAEEEARGIAPLLSTQALTGDAAAEAAVVPLLKKARTIHLATHGLLDGFSGGGVPGAIALAPSKGNSIDGNRGDRTSPDPATDGLLTSDEILGMKLQAELVVLSACNTGVGTITSDGVIGLSRSLILAGVPSVVVSLWSVPDAPTADLMKEFYRQLEQNPNKARALRQAMLKTMQQRPDPKDWAAFTLIGEAE